MIHCSKHRLPENHNCPFDVIKKGKYTKSMDKPLYQDALEFMNKELTVAKIYEYVTANQMNKPEAVELLSYFLENKEDPNVRIVSILAFKELNLKSIEAYKVLESCLLSDEDFEVKQTVKKVIVSLFPDKSKSLLDWISKHDKDLNSNH